MPDPDADHLARPEAPCRFCGETIRPTLTGNRFRVWEHVERQTQACPSGQRWALP